MVLSIFFLKEKIMPDLDKPKETNMGVRSSQLERRDQGLSLRKNDRTRQTTIPDRQIKKAFLNPDSG